jgi:hypothetical protein
VDAERCFQIHAEQDQLPSHRATSLLKIVGSEFEESPLLKYVADWGGLQAESVLMR